MYGKVKDIFKKPAYGLMGQNCSALGEEIEGVLLYEEKN